MSEENLENQSVNEEVNLNEQPTSAETSKPSVNLSDPDVKSLVESMVSEELSGIKAKLNEAYSARDDAIKAKALLEEEKKTVVMKQLEEEGKHKELAELQMAEMSAKLEAMQKRNTELTRDHEVTSALRGIDFRSDVAAEMARDRVLAQAVQDENGIWKHKSGVSIKEFVDHFVKDDGNAFLLKPKINSGAGATNPAGTPDTTLNKPITEMTTEEMLAHFSKQAPPVSGGF